MKKAALLSFTLMKSATHCAECGAWLPAIRPNSSSVQLGKWCCSPECYQAWLDGKIAPLIALGEPMSPGVLEGVGADAPLRLQLEEALKKWGLNEGGPGPSGDLLL